MMKRNSEIGKIRADAILRKNGRVGAIVLFLYENQKGLVDHKELAKSLGVSKSNLSNIFKRIESADVVRSISNGLNKYYYLTDIGMDLYDYISANEAVAKVARNNLNSSIKSKDQISVYSGGSSRSTRSVSPMYAGANKK